jgi:hypothetical protein
MNDSVTTFGPSVLLSQVYTVWGVAATKLPGVSVSYINYEQHS